MRFAFRPILVVILIFSLVACVSNNNFAEGITCFRKHNYRHAFIRLKPEAKKGQRDAQYAVGYMYYYGQGVIEDRRQACLWINRAARAGQADAIEALKIIKNNNPKKITRDPLDPLIFHPT